MVAWLTSPPEGQWYEEKKKEFSGLVHIRDHLRNTVIKYVPRIVARKFNESPTLLLVSKVLLSLVFTNDIRITTYETAVNTSRSTELFTSLIQMD